MFALESMYVCLQMMGCMIIEPEVENRHKFTHETMVACQLHAQTIGDDLAAAYRTQAFSITQCLPIVDGEWPAPTDYHEPPQPKWQET